MKKGMADVQDAKEKVKNNYPPRSTRIHIQRSELTDCTNRSPHGKEKKNFVVCAVGMNEEANKLCQALAPAAYVGAQLFTEWQDTTINELGMQTPQAYQVSILTQDISAAQEAINLENGNEE